jgi:hypothetical protein
MALPAHLAKYNALVDFVVNILVRELTEETKLTGRSETASAIDDSPRGTSLEDDRPALKAHEQLADQ